MRAIFDRAGSDIEFNQSIVRIVLSPVSLLYIFVISGYDYSSYHNLALLYIVSFAYLFLSFVIVIAVFFWPNKFPPRRVFYVLLDVFGATYLMSIGGQATLPVYAALTSAVMGYGVRFGTRYLIFAVATAVLCLVIIIPINSFLSESPYIAATLIVTMLVIPSYAAILIGRLRSAADQAQKADADKSKFLARASHDLRQPIHAIGFLSAQLSQSSLDEKQKALVAKIEGSVEGASKLFQSLLDISTIESGGLEPNFAPVSLSDLFDDLQKQNSAEVDRSGIRLRFVKSELVILTDPILFKVIVQNIITNAMKYAPGNDILIGCRRKGKTISLLVCDQGRGIDPQDLIHISEEFYRGKPDQVHGTQGTGLGLAIVKRLSDLMNLDFEVLSEINRGTMVCVENIPLSDDQPQKRSISQTMRSHQLADMQVLLVDDDEASLNATAALLLHWGCDVDAHVTFSNELLRDPGRYHIIISDFDLGYGHTLAQHSTVLRNMQAAGVTTIVITGHSEEVVQKAIKLDNLMVLSKPVRAADLRSLLMAKKMILQS